MTEFTQPAATVQRDRYGRPFIIPAGGGKPKPYRRVTTFIDVLDDRYNLELWKQRQVAHGLAMRHDLLLKAASANGDKKTLNEVCEAAMEAAGSSTAATSGTALHKITEQLELGEDPLIPPSAQADINAYRKATDHLDTHMVEVFVVHDELEVGGTFDRIIEYDGVKYVADVKTGSIDYSKPKFTMQMALYSRSQLYDPANGHRSPLKVDTDVGLIIHLPTGAGECSLHWVDLNVGWGGVQIAERVWSWRGSKRLIDADAPTPKPQTDVLGLLDMCADRASIEALWRTNEDMWTEEHTMAAKTKLAALETSSPAAAA